MQKPEIRSTLRIPAMEMKAQYPGSGFRIVIDLFPWGDNSNATAISENGLESSIRMDLPFSTIELIRRQQEMESIDESARWNRLIYELLPDGKDFIEKIWDDRSPQERLGKVFQYLPLDEEKLNKPWRWELSPIELHNQLVKSLARRAFNYMPLNAKWKELRMTISMDGTECTLQPEYTDHKGHVIAYEVELSDRMRWDIEDLHALSAGDKPFLAPWKKAVLTVMPDESFDIQYS